MSELSKTALQEWISRRTSAIRQVYSVFDCLIEKGIEEVPDASTPTQMACMFHGADNRPSARYYPREGGRSDRIRCFKCSETWDAVSLYAKFRGVRFMDGLAELERRFHIKTPQRPEAAEFSEFIDRGSSYISNEWKNIPRVLDIAEAKLIRVRDRCGMDDFVKFCRVVDIVRYDFDKLGRGNADMFAILQKLFERMDEIGSLPDDLLDE